MKGKLRTLIFRFVAVIALITPIEHVSAQSQALNGQIEGTVLDLSGASAPDATVTVTNVGTGATRTVTTDQRGVYRIPLLRLEPIELVPTLPASNVMSVKGSLLGPANLPQLNLAR